MASCALVKICSWQVELNYTRQLQSFSAKHTPSKLCSVLCKCTAKFKNHACQQNVADNILPKKTDLCLSLSHNFLTNEIIIHLLHDTQVVARNASHHITDYNQVSTYLINSYSMVKLRTCTRTSN